MSDVLEVITLIIVEVLYFYLIAIILDIPL